MNRAGVFPQVREKLVASGVDAAHFLAWILFCFSQKNTSNYKVSAYPAKRLGEDPTSSPGKGFERLSSLPPSIIRICVDATPSGSQLLQGVQGSGLPEWDDLMGTYNSRIDDLRRILFGN